MGKDKDERKKKDKVSKSDKKEKKHNKKEKHKKDKDKDKHHRHRKDHAVSSSNVSGGSSSAVDLVDSTVPLLTADDFYLRHEEFRVWLHLKERSFEDLSSEQAHQVFEEEFIKQFNKGKLPAMFYPAQVPGGSVNSIPTELREAAMKTKHKWNLKVTDRDRQQQEQVSGEVSRKTRVNTDNAWVHMAPAPAPSTATSSAGSSSSQSKPQATHHQSQSQHFARQKAAAAEYLDNHAAGSGGSDRREAAMQKRDAVGQKMHAASR